MIPYVVHAPYPYCHRSAGIRALYKLADELRLRGLGVSISPLAPTPWGEDECPYPLELASEQTDEAIHVLPEICSDRGHRRMVHWLLSSRKFPANPDDLEFTWLAELHPDLPELGVDLIEPHLFYPKTAPGAGGVLCWAGKGTVVDRRPGWREITYSWPTTRAELASELRQATLLVSSDGFSALNIEAIVCGTPVLLTRGTNPVASDRFGRTGIAYDEGELDEANREVPFAAERYAQTRLELSALIDQFVDRTQEHFLTR